MKAINPWALVFVFVALSLAAVVAVVFVVLGGTEPLWGHLTAGEADGRPHSRADRLREHLNQPVNLDKGIDANTPLKDAIEYLADKYSLTMLIDTKAFEAIGVQKVEEQPVQLPKIVGVSMRTVLRLLMSQIRGDVHSGTFTIRDDHIVLTTTAQLLPTESLQPDEHFAPPTVDIDVYQKPLHTVLRDMADATGINIVLDQRVLDKTRRPVTATLANVPVDSAVRLVADMNGLRVVAVDNVLYVTTPDNAKELQAEQNARRERRQQAERALLAPGEAAGPMPADK